MSDTLITIIAIALAAILMFVFPLMTMADRADSAAQLNVQQAITEFVTNAANSGKITKESYDNLVQKISSTGNIYDVELSAQIKDSNLGKKASIVSHDKIGENVYFVEYSGQIFEALTTKGEYLLKEGDVITAKASNENQTIGDQLKNFFYTVTGNNASTIVSEATAMATANGK